MGAIFLYRMAVHIFMPVIISWLKPESLVLLLLQVKKRCSQVLPPLSNIIKRQYVLLVENFLSIKDKVVLSLLASKDNEHPEHLIMDGNKSYLKSAVIYGANASGKSNVLNAFWFMVNYVLTSHNQQLHKTIDRSPFKFDPETPTRPSSFEVIFTTEGIRYAYGFSRWI